MQIFPLYDYSQTHVGPPKFGRNNRVELRSDTKPLQAIYTIRSMIIFNSD